MCGPDRGQPSTPFSAMRPRMAIAATSATTSATPNATSAVSGPMIVQRVPKPTDDSSRASPERGGARLRHDDAERRQERGCGSLRPDAWRGARRLTHEAGDDADPDDPDQEADHEDRVE